MKKKKQGVPAAVKKQSFKAYMKGHYDLYLLLLPAILYTAVFLYIPMYGVLMAFQDYSPVKGIIGSNFVGLKHFKKFFSTYMAKQIISNTVILSGYSLLASFPFPVAKISGHEVMGPPVNVISTAPLTLPSSPPP